MEENRTVDFCSRNVEKKTLKIFVGDKQIMMNYNKFNLHHKEKYIYINITNN